MLTKTDRVMAANRVLTIIGLHGHRFFYCRSKDRFARFELDKRGRVWFVDDYTGDRIYLHDRQGRWRGFTHGGTIRALVTALLDYIRTGQPINPRYFGPWPEHYCGGDLWGYGDGMEAVRQGVAVTGAVAAPATLGKEDREHG